MKSREWHANSGNEHAGMQADGFSASIDLFPEKELDRVGDSVYTAQVEKMIRTDARLQEIISRKLLDYLLAPDNDNAKNNITTTRNDTEQ